MTIGASLVDVRDILPWREHYRQAMSCQIVHDSLHMRDGWTQSYIIRIDDDVAGYGCMAIGGPWIDRPSIFEFFVLEPSRCRAFELFRVLLETCGAVAIDAQTNDALLTVMLHTFARDIECERILFEDHSTTTLANPGVTFSGTIGDASGTEWTLEHEGETVATGGLGLHYNPPYADVYMEVAKPHRQRGFGSYLVQELKRECRSRHCVPAARCRPDNLASYRTLRKAGFVPCGLVLNGSVAR